MLTSTGPTRWQVAAQAYVPRKGYVCLSGKQSRVGDAKSKRMCGAPHQQASPEAAEQPLLGYACSCCGPAETNANVNFWHYSSSSFLPLDAVRKNASSLEGGRCVTAFSPIGRLGRKSADARVQRMKDTKTASLRYQVEKWLAPTAPVHVTAFGHSRFGRGRYVRVETLQVTGLHALFFFEHDDGYWNVFPPAAGMARRP
ncbi:hypothetical protein OKW45_005437 [Paraburkholderia sp. WSM4175]|uniref:hypothetical protein n=1 Tax=Paraburkholderia sp. WSM4175 TaxID=2991072 RepID=UPI003D2340D1